MVRLGMSPQKLTPRIQVNTALSRRKLRHLLQSLGSRRLTLRNLAVLGSTESEIMRNILRILECKGSVRVLRPRLTLGIQAGRILRAVLGATDENARRRATVNRLVSTILNGTDFARPSIQTRELIEKVHELRASGMSLRKIAREAGVSKTTILRILQSTSMAAVGRPCRNS